MLLRVMTLVCVAVSPRLGFPDNRDAVIEEQQAWLNSTGFETLAQQFQGGKAITGKNQSQ